MVGGGPGRLAVTHAPQRPGPSQPAAVAATNGNDRSLTLTPTHTEHRLASDSSAGRGQGSWWSCPSMRPPHAAAVPFGELQGGVWLLDSALDFEFGHDFDGPGLRFFL